MFPFNLIKKFTQYLGETLKPKTMITQAQLKALTGIDSLQTTQYLNEALIKYEINTPLRISHFLAQTLHESNKFKSLVENMNYSKERLLQVFPKYFNNTTAGQYARNSRAIGNRVYANRMGNGNEASGDGYRYRGRGVLQNTGKDAYKALSDELGVDFLSDPDKLIELKYAFLAAGWYWKKNNLNRYADIDHLDHVSDLINIGRVTPKVGDSNGFSERRMYLNQAKELLM